MEIFSKLLLILALLCFIADAIGSPTVPRVKLLSLGLFFWVLNNLVVIAAK